MYASYPSTACIRKIAEDLLTRKLNCGYESFGKLMNRSKSWCSNFIGAKPEVRGITPNDIFKIFTIEYNCEMFEKKIKRMEQLLNNAIETGLIKPDTQLKDIFKEFSYRGNVELITRFKTPLQIFYGEIIPLTDKIFVNRPNRIINLFKEEEFDEKEQYIPIYDGADLHTLTHNEQTTIQSYILRRIAQIFQEEKKNRKAKCGRYDFSFDYWMYALLFKYKREHIEEHILSLFQRWYCKNNETQIPWDRVFNILQMTDKESSQGYESGEVYFLNKTKRPMSKDNLPEFFIKYDFSKNSRLKEEKIKDAEKGYIKLIDLYMIIHNRMLYEGYKKDDALNRTIRMMYYSGYVFEIKDLDIFDIPYENAQPLTKKSLDFHKALVELLKDFDFDDNDPELAHFKKNYFELGLRMMRTICVDYQFLMDLGMYADVEIQTKVSELLENYKKENL